jgi:hypothetical protein
MNKIIKALFAAAAVATAAQAGAATATADVPVSIEIIPSCSWKSATNDPNLLTTSNTAEPIRTQFNVAAACNTGIAYSITADVQQKTVSKAGESVQISLHPDASRTSYLANAPLSGVAGELVDVFSANVNQVIYLKVAGQGAGGGFLSGGTIPMTSFTLTINY